MNPHYALGIVWHLGAEVLLKGGTGEAAFRAAAPTFDDFGLDPVWSQWLLAAYLAWERAKQDEFLGQYEIVTVEEEFEIPVSPNVVLYTRADAVMRDRMDGTLWVLNWKTASDIKDWNKKWFFDPQGWTESMAAEAKLGEEVKGCIYVGVWKGPIYQGRTTSRLIGGYKHNTRSGTTYATENGGGGQKFDAWRENFPFGDGLAAWISWLPKDFLAKHFCESAPQLRQDALVESWLRQIVKHEDAIDYVLEAGSEQDQLDFFWQNYTDECSKCPFKDLCLLRSTPEELIKDGFLRPRHRSPRDEAEERSRS